MNDGKMNDSKMSGTVRQSARTRACTRAKTERLCRYGASYSSYSQPHSGYAACGCVRQYRAFVRDSFNRIGGSRNRGHRRNCRTKRAAGAAARVAVSFNRLCRVPRRLPLCGTVLQPLYSL